MSGKCRTNRERSRCEDHVSLQFQSSRTYVTVLIYIEDSLVGVIVIISMTNEERIDNEDESGWACDIDRIRLKECGGYLRKRT